MDWDSLRSLFPVTRDYVYLNNAAETPLNQRVYQRLKDYLTHVMRAPHMGLSIRTPLRQHFAKIFGGSPAEYAIVPSTGAGIGLVAAGYPWSAGDNLVLPAEEHWNNTFPWLLLRERGVEVRRVPMASDGRVSPAAVAAYVDERTRVVAIAAVRHSNGYRADLVSIGRVAHMCGALLVVDGIQAAGAMPLDVDEAGIDVLAAGGFKWLLGQPGTGLLYVRQEHWERIRPVLPGMYAAEDNLDELCFLPTAQRYETGSLANPLLYAWAAGLELILEIGVPRISQRLLELTEPLLDGLHDMGMHIHSPHARPDERSGIVSFSCPNPDHNAALVAALGRHGIQIALRAGLCRVSPHFFNSASEIQALLKTCAETLREF